MYFVPALSFGIFAGLLYVPGFFEARLLDFTPAAAIEQALFLIFGLISAASLARSLELDPFWPWRPGFRAFFDRLFSSHH